mmetsp:Transcript_38126/g.109381  ORF Transcript_38126/g.109381 Transcript_38126/m.109381 type:complete len:217 (+) Transcript_38126:434-1084(+)
MFLLAQFGLQELQLLAQVVDVGPLVVAQIGLLPAQVVDVGLAASVQRPSKVLGDFVLHKGNELPGQADPHNGDQADEHNDDVDGAGQLPMQIATNIVHKVSGPRDLSQNPPQRCLRPAPRGHAILQLLVARLCDGVPSGVEDAPFGVLEKMPLAVAHSLLQQIVCHGLKPQLSRHLRVLPLTKHLANRTGQLIITNIEKCFRVAVARLSLLKEQPR